MSEAGLGVMAAPQDLAAQQALWATYLRQPAGVTEQAVLDELLALCCDARGTAARGLQAYQNTVWHNWKTALTHNFPVLTQLLSVGGMAVLARDYLTAYPSHCGDLGQLGHALPQFLTNYTPLADYPYLPEVARLEWAWGQAHIQAASPVLTGAALAALAGDAPELLLQARVRLTPSTQLLAHDCAAVRIWQIHHAGAAIEPLSSAQIQTPEYALVYRESSPFGRVGVRALSAGQYQWLEALRLGQTLQAAFEHLESLSLTIDFEHDLALWLELGLWQALELPQN